MRRRLVVSLLCALSASASAAGTHEWYVLKTDDGVYAYDAGAVTSEGDGRSVWILVASDSDEGYSEAGYVVNCRTNSGEFVGAFSTHNRQEEMLMAEGNGKPTDPGWAPIPGKSSMKIAADVACIRNLENAIRVDDRQAAIDKLKTLSN